MEFSQASNIYRRIKILSIKKIIFGALSIIVFLFSFPSLFAGERTAAYQKGDQFIFLSGGVGSVSGTGVNWMLDRSLYKFEASMNLASTDPERRMLGVMNFMVYEDPSANSSSFRIGYERGIKEWLGVTLALSRMKTTVKDVYAILPETVYPVLLIGLSNGDLGSPMCVTPLIGCANSPPGQAEYLNLLPHRGEMEALNTLDIAFTFHIPAGSNLDPYISLGLGYGSASGIPDSIVTKGGVALGVRYIFESNFFIFLEASADNHTILITGTAENTMPSRVQANVRGVNGGVGVRL